MFYVLAAYSMYNSEVGYCQGMSQVAAILLMYMNEEVISCRQFIDSMLQVVNIFQLKLSDGCSYMLTLWTPEAGIPAAGYINATARRR